MHPTLFNFLGVLNIYAEAHWNSEDMMFRPLEDDEVALLFAWPPSRHPIF